MLDLIKYYLLPVHKLKQQGCERYSFRSGGVLIEVNYRCMIIAVCLLPGQKLTFGFAGLHYLKLFFKDLSVILI